MSGPGIRIEAPPGHVFATASRLARGQRPKVHVVPVDEVGILFRTARCRAFPASGFVADHGRRSLSAENPDACLRCVARVAELHPEFRVS